MMFLTLLACKKKEDDPAPAPKKSDKTIFLTAGEWIFSSVKADPPFDTVQRANTIPNCEKDNIFVFLTDGNGSEDEGVTKCEVSDPQNVGFKWSWENMESELMIIYNASQDTVLLQGVTINETTFSGKIELIELAGVVYFQTYTYKKK